MRKASKKQRQKIVELQILDCFLPILDTAKTESLEAGLEGLDKLRDCCEGAVVKQLKNIREQFLVKLDSELALERADALRNEQLETL